MSTQLQFLTQEQQARVVTMMSNAFFAAFTMAYSIFHCISSIAGATISELFGSTVFYFTIGEDFNSFRIINAVISLLTAWIFYKVVSTTYKFIRFVFINMINIYKILEAVCVKVFGGIYKTAYDYRRRRRSRSALYDRRASDEQQNRRQVSTASSGIVFSRIRSAFDTIPSTSRQQQQQQYQQRFDRHPNAVVSPPGQQQQQQQFASPVAADLYSPYPSSSHQQLFATSSGFVYYNPISRRQFVPVIPGRARISAPTTTASFVPAQQHQHQKQPAMTTLPPPEESVFFPVSNASVDDSEEDSVYPSSFSTVENNNNNNNHCHYDSEEDHEGDWNEEECNKAINAALIIKNSKLVTVNTSARKKKPVVLSAKIIKNKRALKRMTRPKNKNVMDTVTSMDTSTVTNNKRTRSESIESEADIDEDESEILPRPSKKQRHMTAKADAKMWADKTFRK